jgi:hypothetical protein
MPADIRRLEYAHREPRQEELRRISPRPSWSNKMLSTGNRYFWQLSVNTHLKGFLA